MIKCGEENTDNNEHERVLRGDPFPANKYPWLVYLQLFNPDPFSDSQVKCKLALFLFVIQHLLN